MSSPRFIRGALLVHRAMLVLALTSLASRVEAAGTIQLSWDRPASPGQPPIRSKFFSGPGSYDLFVTVTGQSVPVRVFQVELKMGVKNPACPNMGSPPAAWRFEGGGCQAGHACFLAGGFLEPGSPLESQLQHVSSISYDPFVGGRVLMAEAIPLPLATPDPNKTYTLARFRFEHLGTCAGETDSMYVAIRYASWVTYPQEAEYFWLGVNEAVVVWNSNTLPDGVCRSEPAVLAGRIPDVVSGYDVDPFLPRCERAVPTTRVTWGAIKGGYR